MLIGFALYSAGRLVRARRARRSVPAGASRIALGNVLIAAGTLILSASGTLSARLGEVRSFLVTLVAGITVLFAGFLVATVSAPRPRVLRSAEDASEDLAARVAG